MELGSLDKMLLEDVEGQSSWTCVAVLKWTEAVWLW